MKELPEIQQLLGRVQKPPGEEIPEGLSVEELNRAESSLGLRFPTALRQWLSLTNGPCVGPGAFVGIRTRRQLADMEKILSFYPAWIVKGFIPVATDGCGNFYVAAVDRKLQEDAPILFIDTQENPSMPAYIAASDLGRFILFFLRKELGESRWPFCREYVLDIDPESRRIHDVPLPWET